MKLERITRIFTLLDRCAAEGINLKHYLYLCIIGSVPGCTHADIRLRSNGEKGMAFQLRVRRLIVLGLVERGGHANRPTLHLTPAGRDVLTRCQGN